MGHSQADKAQSHEKIVAHAARRIREAGVDGASIPELMAAAGLTHGGFYRHFAFREELIAEALERAMGESKARSVRALAKRGGATLQSLLDSYLHPQHRDEPGKGCAIAAMAVDVGRGGDQPKEILTRHLKGGVEDLEALLGRDREAALVAFSTLVGALLLSRAVDDPALSEDILAAARRALAKA